jgi:hypothetical protein
VEHQEQQAAEDGERQRLLAGVNPAPVMRLRVTRGGLHAQLRRHCIGTA